MEKFMEKFIATFENLIRRGIAPSVAFFVLFAATDLLRAKLFAGVSADRRLLTWGRAAEALFELVPDGILALGAFLLILGLSYVLTTINQLVFEEFLRNDYEGFVFGRGWRFRGGNNARLRALRERVKSRMEVSLLERLTPDREDDFELTDFMLYEILGGIDPTDTRPFMDSARSLGVVFVSALLSLWISGLTEIPGWGWLFWLLMVPVWLLGREAVMAQDRARSIRHYVNFLMMPDSTLESLLRRHELRAEEPAAAD